MSEFRVLHFDDAVTPGSATGEAIQFAALLKRRLYRVFADQEFSMESRVIDSQSAFDALLSRIEEFRNPSKSVDLVLIDLRLELRPTMKYEDLENLEGLLIARKIADIDPERKRLYRAFLTRTRHRRSLSTNMDLADALKVDFLTKDPLPSDPTLWTRPEAFPDNVIQYITHVAGQLGKWS
jgi:hypothetical protein